MIFLVLSRSRKMIFLFGQKYDLTPRRKMKDDISQKKIRGNTILSSNVLKRWSFENMQRWGLAFVVLFENVVFFSRKGSIFPWAENKKYTEIFFLSDTFHDPLPKKLNYDLIPQKHN